VIITNFPKIKSRNATAHELTHTPLTITGYANQFKCQPKQVLHTGSQCY